MEVDENDTFKSKIFKPNYPKILTNVLEFFFQSHAIVRTALLTDESEPAPQEQHTGYTTDDVHRGHSVM